jgi:hypothetical protein
MTDEEWDLVFEPRGRHLPSHSPRTASDPRSALLARARDELRRWSCPTSPLSPVLLSSLTRAHVCSRCVRA